MYSAGEILLSALLLRLDVPDGAHGLLRVRLASIVVTRLAVVVVVRAQNEFCILIKQFTFFFKSNYVDQRIVYGWNYLGRPVETGDDRRGPLAGREHPFELHGLLSLIGKVSLSTHTHART